METKGVTEEFPLRFFFVGALMLGSQGNDEMSPQGPEFFNHSTNSVRIFDHRRFQDLFTASYRTAVAPFSVTKYIG